MKFSFKENSIIVTIILIVSFFSCTKYEKGPKISIRNKENLLFQTDWSLINITKNNIPYYYQYAMKSGNDTLSFTYINLKTKKLVASLVKKHYAVIYITTDFNKKNNELYITPLHYTVINVISVDSISENTASYIPEGVELLLPEGTSTYKILRLTKEELILRSTNLPNTYELHFLRFRKNER